jgi:hypothetical protein
MAQMNPAKKPTDVEIKINDILGTDSGRIQAKKQLRTNIRTMPAHVRQ